jgi:predicted permease
MAQNRGTAVLKLLRRLNYWIRRGQFEADLAAEIEAHRTMEEEQLRRRGLQPEEAHRESRRRLGNQTLALEDSRHIWLASWIESVWQDAYYAFRMIRRGPSFAVSIVLVMALGIGATAGVFGLVDALVLRSLPVREPGRLVYLSRPSFSYPVFMELRARSTHFLSDVSGWNVERMNVDWGGGLEPADVLSASGDFYSTVGVHAAAGRVFTATDDRIGGGPDGLVAVISYAVWQRRFAGSPTVIGRTVRIERRPFTIVGVSPRGFFGVAPGLAPEVTIPLTVLDSPDRLRSTTSSRVHLLGRLRDGFTVRGGDAALQAIWPALLESTTSRDAPADQRAQFLSRTTSLESARTGFSRVRNQFEEPLTLLLALVGLLLAVATASAANLLLARGVARSREFGVRMAIGAGRVRLVRQMITETLVWTIAGAALGLLAASWGSRALVAMMTTWEEKIVLETGPTWRILAITLTLSFITSAIAAALPALRATRRDAGARLRTFRHIDGGSIRRWTAGRSLVAVQIALTVLLLFGAALFGRSLLQILGQNAGVDRDAVLVVSTDAEAAGYEGDHLATFHQQLLQRIQAIPGAESASLSRYPPISDEDGAWTQSVAIDGAPVTRDAARVVYFNVVTPGFFGTVGMRIVQGRDFSAGDTPSAPRVVIVSESLARAFFPGQNTIGRRISIGRDKARQDLEIVGVVSDAKYQRLQEPARRIAFMPTAQLPDLFGERNLFAEVRVATATGPIGEAIRREIRVLDSTVPVRIQTVTERIRESLVNERVLARLAATLSLAAVVLACAGLYGLLAYTVSRQTSEIGVRLALGAERLAMLWMVLRQCLVLAAVGTAAGIASAFALGRLAVNLLYQVSGADPLALAGAAACMLAVALAAGLVPAWRASRVDPLVALRSE